MATVTGGDKYFTMAPCRFLDTRSTPNGPGKGPILAADEIRIVPIVGNPVCSGIPANATGVTGSLTVTGMTAPGALI